MDSQLFSLISLLIMQPERPKTYQKGPDVMSKSEWTQQQHARDFRGQGQLTGFEFKAPSYPTRVVGPKAKANLPVSMQNQLIAQPLASPTLPDAQIARLLRTRSASVLSDPLTDGEVQAALGLADVNEMDAKPEKKSDLEFLADDIDDEELEDWEAKLDESVQGPKIHVQDWTDLRKQIKDHLKKNSKILPLSRLNQLLIISNFATLRLKGIS